MRGELRPPLSRARAGPRALAGLTSYPPPISALTVDATLAIPLWPHLQSVQSAAWLDWWAAKSQDGSMAGARERGPHCPACVHPEFPGTEVGEGSDPSPRPCFSPDLALQGHSGSDRTGAAHTWPRAVPILTPARPRQLSGTQLPS